MLWYKIVGVASEVLRAVVCIALRVILMAKWLHCIYYVFVGYDK